jgi:5-methylcytosine-specific restriction protein A
LARTHGHGNPKWGRDETILALALYFECEGVASSLVDERVQELSDLLRRLSLHDPATQRESFRNPDSIRFKIQNLRMLATGKGLANVSKMDRIVWSEFGSDRSIAARLAKQIKAGIQIIESPHETLQDEEEAEEFFEGRVLTRLHKRIERNGRLRSKLLDLRRSIGRLACDMCYKVSQSRSPIFEDAVFEAHHLVPISLAIERTTRIKEMALLCAGCHRLLHRAISLEKRWISIAEGRKIVGLPNSY